MDDIEFFDASKTTSLTIVGLPGSLRSGSFNRKLLRAAAELNPAGASIEVFEEVTAIPLFNEDVEAVTGHGPESVRELRRRIGAADGLLIATPEYNQSVPGVLKNMLDWLSRPGPAEVLIGKPVAVIGASGGPWGTRIAQATLRQMLIACEAVVMPGPALYARKADALFDESGRLTDAVTREKLVAVLGAFMEWTSRVREPTIPENDKRTQLVES